MWIVKKLVNDTLNKNYFEKLCFPEAQNRMNWRTVTSIADSRHLHPLKASVQSLEETGVYRKYLPSACVDMWPSPKTGVLALVGLAFAALSFS